MRAGRAVVALWTIVIVVLVVLELAEVTHLFTFPISAAVNDPVTLLVSLVFTTILAIIGAIFVGIYASARLLRPRGFSPFEEEMLRMREELGEVRRRLDELRSGPEDGPRAGGGRP